MSKEIMEFAKPLATTMGSQVTHSLGSEAPEAVLLQVLYHLDSVLEL